MVWVIFVAGAVLAWGAYGALLHLGQTQLGNPLKALLCVGVAYFLIGAGRDGGYSEFGGGFGGYLAGDSAENEWLLSPALKTLVDSGFEEE